MCRTNPKLTINSKLLFSLAAAAAMAVGMNQARATQDPAGCTANNFSVNISKNHQNVTNGTVVTYIITVQNFPGANPSSVSGPILILVKSRTLCPNFASIRRICTFDPSRTVISKTVFCGERCAMRI